MYGTCFIMYFVNLINFSFSFGKDKQFYICEKDNSVIFFLVKLIEMVSVVFR